MRKLDRLGWTAGLTFKSFGVRFGVRSDDPRSLEHLTQYLPPGTREAAPGVVERLYSIRLGGEAGRGVRRFNLLYANHVRLARTTDAEELFERFESDLQLTIAEGARRRVFLHAGVVGWRGRAVLVPGRSFSGKTTLTAELVRAGATYYSDEYAVLDREGRVHPYAKPLSVRDEGGSARQRKVAVEEFGGRGATKPLPVGLVVVSEYKGGGTHWRPRSLSMGRGSLALLEHAVPARTRPAEVLETLEKVVRGAIVLSGARGEAAEAARSILERAS
ncbi:MAG: hypothetical protein QOE46_2767 [Acidobacteriota bacterium]|jgi:hypothetical protein|nr:hypothetical protein [Acidobacteriota bacterium]